MATKKETAVKETKTTATKETKAKTTRAKKETVEKEEATVKKATTAKVEETKAEEKTEVKATKTYYKPYNKGFGGKRRKKFCKFCAKGIEHVDYKDVETLKKYLNHHLKIMSARLTGTCSKHQKRVSNAIKRARIVALIPFIIQD